MTIVYLKKNMKLPITTSLREQTPIRKKAITYMTSKKSKYTYYESKKIII